MASHGRPKQQQDAHALYTPLHQMCRNPFIHGSNIAEVDPNNPLCGLLAVL